ncbi:hypothetical protein QWZ04_16405 [Vibrio tapetis subsp. quintayensis]|uniref:hypothetical protein n=1 Tax=Vibrio tapetis TaxID=52443 RepID=UPI0025B419BD|nr:hypothetical protein [Vibrio tapetis]MDN3681889.1 hypothetical protein [Vibrio tapetis subsp. quintayensis]
MPKVYCEACDKKTDHKSIMRKNPPQCTTFLEKLSYTNQSVFQFICGKHYYDMERQHYCRVCNHQNSVISMKEQGLTETRVA